MPLIHAQRRLPSAVFALLAPWFVLMALLTLATSASAAPPSFFALTAGGGAFGNEKEAFPLSEREGLWDEIQATGVKTYRMRMDWIWVSPSCGSGTYNFELYDDLVRRAATHGITVIADLYGLANGCETGNAQYPVPGTADYGNWSAPGGFVDRIVRRYGFSGTFWAENPSVPYHPIEAWEVWNEVNAPQNNPPGGVQPHQYGRFLVDTARAIRAAQAEIQFSAVPKVLLGGLSTASASWMPVGEYIHRMYTNVPTSGPSAYSAAELHAAFDGMGLHPYAIGGMPAEAENIVLSTREEMDEIGDGAKSIWVTELGWPSGDTASSQELQAKDLKEALGWLKREAASRKIEVATWYFLRDVSPNTGWASEAGLKDVNGAQKPSWCAFLTLNGRTCAPAVAAGTTPSVSRDADTGYTFMAYRTTGGQVAYSYRAPGEGWVSSTLGGSVAEGTSPSMVRSQSAQHVFIAYRTPEGRIGYWYWTASEGWVNGVLGAGVPADVAEGSSPSLVWDPSFTAIYYRSAGGGIAYWYWTQATGWQHLTLGGSVAARTSPGVSRDPISGYTFVAYTSPAGHIGYWLWSNATGWINGDLGAADPVSTNTSPSVVRNEGAQHVLLAYRDTSARIGYWYWTATEGWVNGSLPGGQGVAAGASPNLVWDPSYTGIAYRNSASGLSMWSWTPSGGWSNFNVPTSGWLSSDATLVRDPATGNASLAYANQKGQATSLSWLFNVAGGWIQVVP